MSKMFYAIYSPTSSGDDLIFDNIKEASQAMKKHDGSRMKSFSTKEAAERFIENPEIEESFMELSFRNLSQQDELVEALDKLELNGTKTVNDDIPSEPKSEYRTPEPRQLTELRRKIESDDYEAVEQMIWENPKYLVTVCDSAVYLMAGPKYNACHIAARSNRPEIMGLILDTVSNTNFLRKLYPNESDSNVQERVNHLLDSYLNTPEPRQGNTPLQFACKLGHPRIVRVLLTFEGCDQTQRDSQGRTSEECICLQKNSDDEKLKQQIKDMFKSRLNLPLHRDQLKKRLSLVKKTNEEARSRNQSFS